MKNGLGLKYTFRHKAIQPFWEYRNQGREAGTIISFEKFLETRPDGGEKLLNAEGKPLTWPDIYAEMGIDHRHAYLMNIASRPDDFAFAFGPALEDPILKGFLEMPDGQPAMWQQLCAVTGVPTQNESLMRSFMRFDGRPLRTGEGANLPVARVLQSKETLAWGKMGLRIELTIEFLKANPMPIVETYLDEVGRLCQHEQDRRCIQALINGDLPTGANACPVVGVASTANGFAYIDCNTVWTRGARIKERWFTVVAGETISGKIGMMDEFKRRDMGQPLIVLGNRPEPREMKRFVVDMPNHQALFVDTSHALRHRSFLPPLVQQSLQPQNLTEGVSFAWSDFFERIADRAVVAVDETLLLSEYGFPSWFVVGGARQWVA